jgi:two-component system, NarL family, nitrate/nitrite response regulator NarL
MATRATIKLVLMERQRLIRDALRLVLQSADILVVGEASDATELLTVVAAQQPDVVLVAFDGAAERDLALLQGLPNIAEQARTLVLTDEVDTALHARAIELGAMGLVLKSHPAELLVKAVQKVNSGEIWLDRAQTAIVVTRLTRKRIDEDPESERIDSLTARERQIVTLVAEGLRNKQVAERLFISEATARNHLTSILDKLGLSNRFDLAVFAFRRGLVFCPQTPAMLRSAGTPRPEPATGKRMVGLARRHSA